MKKFLKRALILVLVLLAGLVLVVKFKLNDIAKAAIESMAPDLLGVPVTLASVDIRPLRGQAALRGLVVGNPEGYKTPSVFELDSIMVKLDMGSLKTDTVHIQEILITKPSITYEKSLKQSNLAQLLENLEGDKGEEEPAVDEPAEVGSAGEGGGKKVVIDLVRVVHAQVRLSTALLMGKAITLPLPLVEVVDIGKESREGTSIPAALALVLREVLSGVTSLVGSAGGLALDGAKLAGEGALATGGLAIDAADAVGGTAVDAAGAAGGVAVEGVKSVGAGAAKLTRGLGGLLGAGHKDEQDAAVAGDEKTP